MSHQISIRSFTTLIFILSIGLVLAFGLTSLAKAGGRAVYAGTSGHPATGQIKYDLQLDQSSGTGQAPNPAPKAYYVAKTGNGSDGLDWTNAFTDVQHALAAAIAGDEIWVASGIYTPGIKQTHSFILKPGVGLYGGFAGTETTRSERNWVNNVTVLSGDIGGDDTTDRNGIVTDTDNLTGSNNYHVIYAINVFSDTVLDGFSITSGKADGGTDFYKVGGGIFCNGSGVDGDCSPTLNNLKLSGNKASNNGGGVYNDATFNGNSSPSLMSVTFSGNKSLNSGGAIYNDGNQGISSPDLEDVKFFGNSADNAGGAIYNYNDNGTISSNLNNIEFSGNSAGVAGGAIYNFNGNGSLYSNLNNIVFSGNSAGVAGGAIYNNGIISPTLSNITFSGNRADLSGGALFNNGTGNIEIRNSIIWNNQDNSGVGTINASIRNISNATTTLKNSLAQGTGGSSSWISDTSYVNGGGNIDEDPLFIEPISPTTAPTTTGNLRLQSISPAIDTGDNTFIAGISTDLDGSQRIVDGNSDGTPVVDMGAYEVQIDFNYDIYLPVVFR